MIILHVYESNLLRLHSCLFPKTQGNSPKASSFAHLYMFKFVQVAAVLRTVAVNVHLFPQTKAGAEQTGTDSQ